MSALVGAHNQEKALVGAFSVIVKTDGSFASLICGVLTNFLQLWLADLWQARYRRLVAAPRQAADLRHEVVLIALAAAVHEQFAASL